MSIFRTAWVGLIASAMAVVACGGEAASTPVAGDTTPSTIAASVLIEPNPDGARWVRDVQVSSGSDGYELLEAATAGDIVSEWYPEYGSHFVSEILGIAPTDEEFWGVFVWNSVTTAWEPLPVGADLFTVEDGQVMAWAIVGFSSDEPQLPVNVP